MTAMRWLLLVLLAACHGGDIGRPCTNPLGMAPQGNAIGKPEDPCNSQLCLITPSADSTQPGCTGGRCICTAACITDGDCPSGNPFGSCASGYTCAVALTVGSECCDKLCMCKDDLTAGFNATMMSDGTLQPTTPFACDRAANPNGITCNNVK